MHFLQEFEIFVLIVQHRILLGSFKREQQDIIENGENVAFFWLSIEESSLVLIVRNHTPFQKFSLFFSDKSKLSFL
jgi:hypothetical protein